MRIQITPQGRRVVVKVNPETKKARTLDQGIYRENSALRRKYSSDF